MNKPNGFDLLTLLIDLYADQHGLKVTYEFAEQAEKKRA